MIGRVRTTHSRQREDGNDSLIDAPHLLVGQVADELSEPLGIDGAQLLHEHSRDDPLDVRLGPERCWTGTSRRRSNDDDGTRKKLVCLEDHAVACARLLVSDTTGCRNRWTSPRSTEILHQLRHCQHLGAVHVVCLQRGDFSREFASTSQPASRRK